jgi:acetylornithine/N-succinyldiaminopimelate aminotransferase
MITPVLPSYSRAPLSFVKGEGAWLMEADGRRFLDFGAGIAVMALGHCHPVLVYLQPVPGSGPRGAG